MLLVVTLTLLSSPSQPSTPPIPCSPLSCTPSLPDLSLLAVMPNRSKARDEKMRAKLIQRHTGKWPLRHPDIGQLNLQCACCCLMLVILRAWWFQFALFFFFMPISISIKWQTPCQSKDDVWVVFQDWLHVVFSRIAAVCSGVSFVYS